MKRIHWFLILALVAMLLPGCSGFTAPEASPASSVLRILQEENNSIEPLFDFYTIPSDWPKGWIVPLMNEFKVTAYEWSAEVMYAAGYGDVSMSRASNFYTNALRIHVSTNIWEQDPQNPSDTEGEEQVFNYVSGEKTLKVLLRETDNNRIEFELYYTGGATETGLMETSVTVSAAKASPAADPLNPARRTPRGVQGLG